MSVRQSSQRRAIDVSLNFTSKKLWTQILRPKRIDEQDKTRMFLLMRKYYEDVEQNQFLSDLDEKSDVIILRDGSGEIRGFSTLLTKENAAGSKTVGTVFSGDTIVEREFWGQKELGVAFLKYLFLQKLKRPFQPLYWMLMSKGYKTYLMMANNFKTHYPRYEADTPRDILDILNNYYREKFGTAFDKQSGLITPLKPAGKLREEVAPITQELKSKYPRINFFAGRNPNWNDGIELACIAEMKLLMPAQYFFKKGIAGILGRRKN